MNAAHNARLRRLEKRTDMSDDDLILFGWTETADGTVTAYHVHNDGKTYTPAAFDRLVDERADAVFVPLQSPSELAAAASQAYWEELEANQLTWEEMQAENARVKRIRRELGDADAGDDPDDEISRGIAIAFGVAGDGAEGDDADRDDADREDAEADDDAWIADVSLGSDRATLARYHEWLMEGAEPWYAEMAVRKARLDGRPRR